MLEVAIIVEVVRWSVREGRPKYNYLPKHAIPECTGTVNRSPGQGELRMAIEIMQQF